MVDFRMLMMMLGTINYLMILSIAEINLQKFDIDAKLSNMFLDPSGQHLILTFSPKDSLNPAEVMYIAPKSPKPKDIVALKGHVITAVAWNSVFDGPFLLGTSKGAIFEGEVINGDVKNLKQVNYVETQFACEFHFLKLTIL